MALRDWSYETRYVSVQQYVRRYRPSALLPALAALASDVGVQLTSEDLRRRTPWALAALAKESIVRGNEHRPAEVPTDVAAELVHRFNLAFDLPKAPSSLAELMVPIAYEQMPYQQANYTDLARARALLIDTPLPARAGPDVARWDDVLGMSLDLASQATFVLWVWANQNRGVVDLSLLDSPQMQAVLERVPRATLAKTAARLTATVEQAKADYHAQPRLERRLERFAYNPLSRTPLIDLGGIGLVAPQPALIPMTVTPSSLYYVGAGAWGDRFLNQLGDRFEAYVGRQLHSVDSLNVYPEVVYGKPEKKSVDWFVISDEAVVLVECKLGRPVLEARAGADTLVKKYVEKLEPARRQINETVERIREQSPAFAFVPTDRPLLGLVITFEEFFLANDDEFDQHMQGVHIPTLYASVKTLESLLDLDPGRIIRLLLDAVAKKERSAWSLGAALVGETPTRRNAILDQAWDAMNYLSENVQEGTQ